MIVWDSGEFLRELFGLGQGQPGSDLNEELGSSKESERHVTILDGFLVSVEG